MMTQRNMHMRKQRRGLVFKIGTVVFLVELVIFSVVGGAYMRRFFRQLDTELESRIQVPAALMSENALSFNAAGQEMILQELVGATIVRSLFFAEDGKVYFSTVPEYEQMQVTDIPDVQLEDVIARDTVWTITKPESLIYAAPVYSPEIAWIGHLYLEVSTESLTQQKGLITLTFVIGSALGVMLTTVLIVYLLNSAVVGRINNLLNISQRVEAGDLQARIPAPFAADEIGKLQQGVNAMVDRLESTVTTLEERVEQRTGDLARRSEQLQAVSEVGGVIASIRDFDVLLQQITHLISERFGFYHVGIFLLDASGEYAVLRAANSEGGQHMLAQHYRLPVGEEGLGGYEAGTNEPRIILDVGEQAVCFDNPHLPDTRSEVCLPLRVGGDQLGMLDIQSTEAVAFTQEDITVLQALAGQVAVAIDNARLIADARAAAEAQQRAYGEMSRQAWENWARSRHLGYRSDAEGQLVPVTGPWQPEMVEAKQEGQTVVVDAATVTIPVKLRGEHVIGVLKFRKPDELGAWSSQEINLLETLADRLGQALESARLFEASQRLAYQERLVGEVSARVRQSLEMESVLQAAVRELSEAFNLSDMVIRIGTAEDLLQQSHKV